MRRNGGRKILRMKVSLGESDSFVGDFRRHVETLTEKGEKIKGKEEKGERRCWSKFLYERVDGSVIGIGEVIGNPGVGLEKTGVGLSPIQ